jgi:hypothetical protein
MPERRRALLEARRLVARGSGYESVVDHLVMHLGLPERRARAVTAEAFRPRRGMTLAQELERITRLLDAVSRSSSP